MTPNEPEIGTKLEDLTMRQLRDLSDGTTVCPDGDGEMGTMAKVGSFWVDGETGLTCILAALADSGQDSQLEKTYPWEITHVPVPAGTQQSINRQFKLITDMCQDSGLFVGELELLSPFQRVQHLLFLSKA